MASKGKAALESGIAAPGTATVNLFTTDLSLRLVFLSLAVTSLGVMVTSKQTKLIGSPLLPAPIALDAKFTYSPATIYFVVAMSVACLYGVVSISASVFAISKPSPSARLLLCLAFVDTLMAAMVASATGAVASIAYVGLKGNSHIGWNKVCNVFDKFCRHVGGSIALSLAASLILILLAVTSTYSLYRRSH